jgi:hypothetical protein
LDNLGDETTVLAETGFLVLLQGVEKGASQFCLKTDLTSPQTPPHLSPALSYKERENKE